MAARGGRFFCYVSSHGPKVFRASKQVSFKRTLVTLSSSISVLSKSSSFQDACALPVNKFDLTCGGGLLTASALFSTTFQSGTDEVAQTEEDAEASKENRWPSPISQVGMKDCTIFVGGFDLICSEDELSKLFSTFGEINSVNIPMKRKYENLQEFAGVYKYAFVNFRDQKSVDNALKNTFIETSEGIKIDIKEKSKQSNKELELKRTVIINDLPDDVTADQVYDYFSSFGKIELVNMIYNTSSDRDFKDTRKNYAYIIFNSNESVADVMEKAHTVNNEVVSVKPSNITGKVQRRDRSRKVLIEGLTEGVTEDNIKSYLSEHGNVKNCLILENKISNKFRGIAVVEFVDANDVLNVIKVNEPIINDDKVLIRALGASYA